MYRIALDPLFPPNESLLQTNKKLLGSRPLPENKYHLVFDEKVDGPGLRSYVGQFNKMNPAIVEIDEEKGSSESENEDQ